MTRPCKSKSLRVRNGSAVWYDPLAMRSIGKVLLVVAAWIFVTAVATATSAQTQHQLKKQLEGVEVVEKLGARAATTAPFVDERGQATTVAAKAGGRVVLLSLNYTTCPMLCSLQLAGLAKGVADLKEPPGRRYVLATVSVDPEDTPVRARGTKQRFARLAGGTAAHLEGWHFLTGGADAIRALADSVGFRYRFDPDTREYRHKATLIVLTADGRVSSYLHGIRYEATALRAAIKRAADGVVLSPAQQTGLGGFLLNCFSFDGSGNAPLALRAMRAGGIVVLAFLFSLLGRNALRERRRRREEAPST